MTDTRSAALPLLLISACAACACAQPSESAPPPPLSGAPGTEPLDWESLEAPFLTDHVQLTSREKFVKAGEAYFNADATWIIFQAIPVPEGGREPDPFYSMYIARLVRDAQKNITGIDEPILVSPPGSANSCGWFHPRNDGRILFGSTLHPPSHAEQPGYQSRSNRYTWSFPEEMDIVQMTAPAILMAQQEAVRDRFRSQLADLEKRLARYDDPAYQTAVPRATIEHQVEAVRQTIRHSEDSGLGIEPGAETPTPLFTRPEYDAECSWSADGRFVLYSHVEKRNPDGSADADIWLWDSTTGEHHSIIQAPGYDGGAFFSPDERFITYRSDRRGDNLLQVYIARLKTENGVPVGIQWERPVTDDQNVNWCPYWHPSGKFIVFASSRVGHTNYEVFASAVDSAFLRGDRPPERIRTARITFANGADVLPAFDKDGEWMMWTAQRGPLTPGETKPSSQLWIARVDPNLDPDTFCNPVTNAEAAAIARQEAGDWAAAARATVTRADDSISVLLDAGPTGRRRIWMTPEGKVLRVEPRP